MDTLLQLNWLLGFVSHSLTCIFLEKFKTFSGMSKNSWKVGWNQAKNVEALDKWIYGELYKIFKMLKHSSFN